MLKWLGGGGAAGSSGGNGVDSLTHIGRTFFVGEFQVSVDELIAEGGFAVVYKARTLRGQPYALKRMAVNNDQDLHLAKQEIAITKALSDCPNSVTFMDSSVRKISPEVHEVLILLQLYTGQSVVQLLNQKLSKHSSLSEREVLKIFSDVVVAVGRLHHRTKPIIHRDLKIENILSDQAGNYLLCDYGSCTVNTMHPETMGAAQCEDEIARFTTLPYRAPEMVSLYSGKSITTQADIWALGCLLYKLCFMNTPFGEQPLAIVSAQFTIPQNSPYSEELHSLIRYMLEVDPENRPKIWQVNEVVCRMQGKVNTMPNVFRSPKPPATLPRARKANENKYPSPTKETRSKAAQSNTPTNQKPKAMATVTTTSILSRERPRARGAAGFTPSITKPAPNTAPSTRQVPSTGSAPSSVPTPLTRPTSSAGPVQHTSGTSTVPVYRQHSATPPLRPRPNSRQEAHFIDRGTHLRTESEQREMSKSVGHGLDVFGAVPFNTPITQSSKASTSFTDVRCDLFGSTPFASPVQQQTLTSHPSPSKNPGADDFGAPPFVTCS